MAAGAPPCGGEVIQRYVAQRRGGGSLNTTWNIVQAAQRQLIVPNAVTGRVVAMGRMFAYGATPTGALLEGLVAERAGCRGIVPARLRAHSGGRGRGGPVPVLRRCRESTSTGGRSLLTALHAAGAGTACAESSAPTKV